MARMRTGSAVTIQRVARAGVLTPPRLTDSRRTAVALAHHLEELLKRSTGLDSCILGSAVLIDVLRACGIRAEPMSVLAELWNAAAVRLLSEGVHAGTPEGLAAWDAAGAWSVGVGFPKELVSPEERKPEAEGGRFNGHLVAVTPGGWLIDATLGQASRPHLNMEVGPVVVRVTPAFRAGQDAILGQRRDVLIRYSPAMENRAWRAAPDWTGQEKRRLVATRVLLDVTEGKVRGLEARRGR